jgi:uncharacterized protein YoxC
VGSTLAVLTLIAFLIVVLALVVYLVAIILALRGASRKLHQLAGGLGAIAQDTEPLPQKLTTINGALGQLLSDLVGAEGHLGAVARLLSR